MRSRLHSVLTLLLACLMLGAGTQSAVCELACHLGGRVQCQSAAVSTQSSSGDQAMAGMPQMHCSGMKSTHAAKGSSNGVEVSGSNTGQCTHPSPVATLDPISRGEAVQAVHWIVVEPVLLRLMTASYRIAANSKAPPLLPPVDLLLVTLRV